MSVVIKSSGGPAASPLRLIATMAGAGAIAGLLVVVAYTSATPIILAHRTAATERAIYDVLPGTVRYETLYRTGAGLTTTRPAPVDEPEMVYAGFDGAGDVIGFAIPAKEPGFQDPIEILFGYDPRRNRTLGLTILSSRETPGLGDKIQAEGWRGQFRGVPAPVKGVKRGGVPMEEVTMITGATISSRSVIAAINKGVEHWTPLLREYVPGGGR